MITDKEPQSWREMEEQAARILRECSFSVEVEKVIPNARGNVEIDVYAEETVDGRRYVILCECKHWRSKIPQTVVHAFRTVMADVGANLGLVIASEGFQTGADQSVTFTNVRLVTWQEFQDEFEQTWLKRYLYPTVAERCDPLLTYVEPLAPAWWDQLSEEEKHEYVTLKEMYDGFGWLLMTFSVMLHQLIEKGAVRLSDPVSRFLPEIETVRGLPASSNSPTILQLATMTGGLAAEPDSQAVFGTGPVNQWESKVRSALAHTRYEYAPGTRFSYSNIGYAALGVALERASGTSYLRWQQERILDPLQMYRTPFDLDSTIADDLATGYEVGNDGKVSSDGPRRELRYGRGYRLPIGCVFTTVDDLSRFVAFELGHGSEAVLPHARLDSVYAGIVATSADMDVGYGVGFMSQRRGEFTWLGHSGGVPGYTAMMYFDRDYQLGVIVFRNATGGKARIGRLAPDVLKMLILARIDADKAARGPD